METIKNLLSHSCPSGNLSQIFKKALPVAIKEIEISKGLRKRSDDIKCSNKKNESLEKSEIKKDEFKNSESTSLLKSSSANETNFFKVKTTEKETIKSRIKIITRNIPTTIKRTVWLRDAGQCQYFDSVTGKKCGSKFQF